MLANAPMLSTEIRESFLTYFERLGHRRVPSSSLVPRDDPSVLLTTAGMQQFKPYFMGVAEPPAKRVVSVQKCFRTSDLEEVGDQTHLTFFEMLGNFSFGDYFKAEAIEWAWLYMTDELGLPAERLQPTVHPTDDDAAELWRKVAGKAVARLEDNWWGPTGPAGPCGPDSEIHFDRGREHGCGQETCAPGHCDRWIEVWNLVFNQFDQAPDGTRRPLAQVGVDTGMGVERLNMVVNAVDSIHETDIFKALRETAAAGLSGDRGDERVQYSLRLVADHARATAFLVADGVRPGNEGRGYVLRRMVRRATLHGLRRLDRPHPLSGMVETVAELMGRDYPEVLRQADHIREVLGREEDSFARTLAQGERQFEQIAAKSQGAIGGQDAFKLHDTYGFPIELTVELAREQGLRVDRDAFEVALNEARQRSRRGARKQAVARTGIPATAFLGYDELAANARVIRLFAGGVEAESAAEGDEVEVYLDRTPFYAESGGQVGDTGVLEGAEGTVEVFDVQKMGEAHAHYGRVASGRISVGGEVAGEVDREARWATMRHHSATHLLHAALRRVLGESAAQAGSYVAPDTCTFDFTLDRAVSRDELDSVFGLVARAIRDDIARVTRVMALEEAKKSGAMQLFGEKYGDTVRVVSFGDVSLELCGGTHVNHSGQIGLVLPVSEKSVGAGLRRIEFLAGEPAQVRERELRAAAEDAAALLNVKPAELAGRVGALLDEQKRLRKELEQEKRRALQAKPTNGTQVLGSLVYEPVESLDLADLRTVADRNLDADPGVKIALIVGVVGDRASAVVKTRGGPSATMVFERVKAAGGGKGSGNDRLAQGGGFDPKRVQAMIDAAAEALAEVAS